MQTVTYPLCRCCQCVIDQPGKGVILNGTLRWADMSQLALGNPSHIVDNTDSGEEAICLDCMLRLLGVETEESDSTPATKEYVDKLAVPIPDEHLEQVRRNCISGPGLEKPAEDSPSTTVVRTLPDSE